MAFVACGWGLGRGLLFLAAVGFAFHLQRKVQYLKKQVRKLEDEKELKDVNAEARGLEMQKSEYAVLRPKVSEDVLQKQLKNQQVEAMDKERSRDVEGLEGRVQELEDGNKNLNELYSVASQREGCMKEKLAVAEMQIKEHAVVKEKMSKDLMQLESEKRKLSREVEGLQQLVCDLEDNTTMLKALHDAAFHGRACMEKKLLLAEKKVEDYAALNNEASKILKNLESEKQELQSSLNCALEKVRVKELECEDLAFQNERHLQEKEELQRDIERLCNQNTEIAVNKEEILKKNGQKCIGKSKSSSGNIKQPLQKSDEENVQKVAVYIVDKLMEQLKKDGPNENEEVNLVSRINGKSNIEVEHQPLQKSNEENKQLMLRLHQSSMLDNITALSSTSLPQKVDSPSQDSEVKSPRLEQRQMSNSSLVSRHESENMRLEGKRGISGVVGSGIRVGANHLTQTKTNADVQRRLSQTTQSKPPWK